MRILCGTTVDKNSCRVEYYITGDEKNGYGFHFIRESGQGAGESVMISNLGLCETEARLMMRELIAGEVQPELAREIIAEFLCAKVYTG